ncbi:uncharacterized protein LOC110985702 [Acanthaster planci]|uniref:Uncharacterized protein LOC110985702 n=1 Tax=Acanthaster planci TaxID=133434 RepID=A0A8B7ZCA1_ACAPL|nr:uncharacterized protein LOC110985702 [Acanthaster planci]
MGGRVLKLVGRSGMSGVVGGNVTTLWAVVCAIYVVCCGSVCLADRVVISCDFQNERACGYTQSSNNDFNWIRTKGHSPSWYSGPLADHTYNNSSGYYIYAPSSYNDTQIGQVARFSFPAYQLREGHGRLRFFYHMWDGYEPDKLGTLTVYACHGLPLWSRERRQRDMWLGTGVVDIFCTQPFQLIFEAVRGGFDSDIAVDDIRFMDVYESPSTTAPPSTTTRETPSTTRKATTRRPTRSPRTELKSTSASTLGRIITNSTPNKERKTDLVTPPITWMAGSPSDPPVWTAFVLAGAVGGGFVLCFMAFFVLFFFCRRRRRSKKRSAGISYNMDNLTYPPTGLTPCGRCDAYYTALQTTRGVELHLYQELHQPAKQISDSSSSTTNEAVHSADGGFYECIDEDQFSSVTNDMSEFTEAEAAARHQASNTATLPSKQSLSLKVVEPIPFETGPESPISYVIESVDLPAKGVDDSPCKTPPTVPFLEPKYFTLEPDGQYHERCCDGDVHAVANNEHKASMELSEDEDIMCLSPDDVDGRRAQLNDPVSPNASYCEPPMSDDDPLTPTQNGTLSSSTYGGYIPPIPSLGRSAAVPDRGGRRTEIITEI